MFKVFKVVFKVFLNALNTCKPLCCNGFRTFVQGVQGDLNILYIMYVYMYIRYLNNTKYIKI